VDVTLPDGSVQLLRPKNNHSNSSRANSLPFAPIDGDRIISYRQALVPEKIPASLVVIGSGAIGSEFAYFYRSLKVLR
jgi:dihydrolipoamide dehydrogenase